ncbi:MAG: hypothetical protein JNK72_23320 [Myxococcales bacterium]|nr:hypothetical protein [Myxococcales bacterium]
MTLNIRRISAGFAAAMVLVGVAIPSAEAIPLLNGFGGPSGYGLAQNCVHPNDDGSYAGGPNATLGTPVAIPITTAFPNGLNFYGGNYRTMYVNTNGNITFRGAVPTYTPSAFPIANQPMIAPWWADVDTRGGNPPTNNNICFHVEPNRIVVTWNNVGYYNSHHNFLNDFQLVLTSSSTCSNTGNFDVEFRYNRCEWTTGDASGGTNGRGGTPAQVGFDAGNRMNFVSLPMSRMASILDVCRQTNVAGGQPGLWRFQVAGGEVTGGCTGAGVACTVPNQRGICAQGVQVCAGMGTTCRQVNMPGARRCNGYDNDCDGTVDEDDSLCQRNQVCDRGSCVERCQGELGCLTGRTCTDRGTCIETSCLNVMCPSGQRCSGGMCVGVCDGFSCPNGQTCRGGRCVDPCAGITCGEREICENDPTTNVGRCVPACQCRPCAQGQTCQPDGRCVADACVGVTCPTGQYCNNGTCRDACEVGPDQRICPSGEACLMGQCTPGATPVRDGGTATTDASSRVDVGPLPDTGVRTDSGVRTDTGVRTDAGRSDGGFLTVNDRSTCTCSTVGARTSGSSKLMALGLSVGLGLVLRRRRNAKRAA